MRNVEKILIIVLAVTLSVSLGACGKISAPPEPPQPSTSSDAIIITAEESPQPSEAVSGTAAPVSVTLYHSDETAENIVSEAALLPELSAQALVELLSSSGIIAENVIVNSFSIDGGSILLDLSAEFSAGLNQMGSSGEYLMLGSLVNTFLDAFSADSILITVAGHPLETGHAVYDQALRFFGE